MYGRGGHLGHVTQTPRINFRSPIPLRLHMKFGFDWPSGFGEENAGVNVTKQLSISIWLT